MTTTVRSNSRVLGTLFALTTSLVAGSVNASSSAQCTHSGGDFVCTQPSLVKSFSVSLDSLGCTPTGKVALKNTRGQAIINCQMQGNSFTCQFSGAAKAGVFTSNSFACGAATPATLSMTVSNDGVQAAPTPGAGAPATAPIAAQCSRGNGPGEGVLCNVQPPAQSFAVPLDKVNCTAPDGSLPLANSKGETVITCQMQDKLYSCQFSGAAKAGAFTGRSLTCTADGGAPSTVPLVVTVSPAAPQPQDGSGNTGNSPAGTDTTAAPFLPGNVWAEAMGQLRININGQPVGNYYSSWNHKAVIFVDGDAAPYFPVLDTIDETDDLYVVVVDRAGRLDQATVSVQGCNRPPVEPRVYGSIPKGIFTAGGEPPPAPPAGMSYIIRAFGKCAGATSGGPVVTVKRKEQSQQALTIPVNPVYRFAIGVAAAYDTTTTRTFSAQTAVGDTVPRVAESDDQIGLSSLIYASFYLFARDFRKTDISYFYERTQVFLGLDPRDFGRYLVVGGGIELTQGLSVLAGWRALSQQPVLQEGSGLQVGSPLQGTTVPTRERWETGGFFIGLGVGSDLLSRLK